MSASQKEDEEPCSRSSSRRNSNTQSRRNSLKKEKSLEDKSSHSATSTPKKTPKPAAGGSVEFMVTGKQITKRCDRANSLPGAYHRRASDANFRLKRATESPKRTSISHASKSQETSLEDDMSLDLSQVSDFEDTNSKYGIKNKFTALATSTPKPRPGPKPRSASLHNHIQRMESRRTQKSLDSGKSRDSVFSGSRDSLYKNSSSASPYRCGTDLDYSSVSPEYSGQSSVELSPRAPTTDLVLSPRSQHASSCCVSSWQECSEAEATKVEDFQRGDGDWNEFWVNYNNSLSKVPMKSYYDQCPTPYRTENIDLNDFDFSTDGSRKRSPDNIKNISNIIRNEGLQLTPRETQNIIKCAHILGNVLSKAIERRSRENEVTQIEELPNDPSKEENEMDLKKKNLTLDLKETAIPLDVKEEKRSETVTTQTDISLPNTKSAPRIFESILRQLSKSSIDEGDENVGDGKTEKSEEKKE